MTISKIRIQVNKINRYFFLDYTNTTGGAKMLNATTLKISNSNFSITKNNNRFINSTSRFGQAPPIFKN